tara:strand:+ start:425 stop:994 length:570 start_codon:yes stop_codon:yes gene_type:complete
MKYILSAIGIILLITSCHTSNNVVSKFSIQKRKYNRGFCVSEIKTFSIKKEKPSEVILEEKVELINDLTKQFTNNKKTLLVDKECNKQKITNKIISKSNHKLTIKREKKRENKQINEIVSFVNQETRIYEPKEYSFILLIILALLIPFLAVGLKSNWDLVKVIIALVLWPTIILAILFALLIVYDIIEF